MDSDLGAAPHRVCMFHASFARPGRTTVSAILYPSDDTVHSAYTQTDGYQTRARRVNELHASHQLVHGPCLYRLVVGITRLV